MAPSFIRTLSCALIFLAQAAALTANAEDLPEGVNAQEQFIPQYVDSILNSENPDFDALERFAKELATKSAQHKVYEQALSTFYSQVGLNSLVTDGAVKVTRWTQKNPQSATPVLGSITGKYMNVIGYLRLALFSTWAWPEQPGTHDVLETLRSQLLATKSYTAEDQYWYVLMAEMTIALRRDLSELDAIVEEGLKKHPGNYDLVMAGAAGHLSKWKGSAESLESYAQLVLSLSPPSDGLANYARIYGVALRSQYGAMLFDLAKPDWQNLMAGTRDLITHHPDDLHLNQAAILACVGGNRSLARETLLHPKFVYSDVHWYDIGTEYHPYKICRDWAGQTQAAVTDQERPVPTADP